MFIQNTIEQFHSPRPTFNGVIFTISCTHQSDINCSLLDQFPFHFTHSLLPGYCLPNVAGSDLNSDSRSSTALKGARGSLPFWQRTQTICSLSTRSTTQSAYRRPTLTGHHRACYLNSSFSSSQHPCMPLASVPGRVNCSWNEKSRLILFSFKRTIQTTTTKWMK
jgi:hypothetical protein